VDALGVEVLHIPQARRGNNGRRQYKFYLLLELGLYGSDLSFK